MQAPSAIRHFIVALGSLLLFALPLSVVAQDASTQASFSTKEAIAINVLVGQSRLIAFDRPIERFSVSNPEIAEAVLAAMPGRLMDAVNRGYGDAVRRQLMKGANPNAEDAAAWTPLLLAAARGNDDVLGMLIKAGARVNHTNKDGITPLMAAAGQPTRSPGEDAGTESEVLEAVRVALDLGADVNAVDKNGETAMHGAAYKNLPKVVQYLADKGARIEIWNQKNKFGWTPLLIAEGYRHGNFKPSTETVAALHRVMIAAGVSPPAGQKSQNLPD